MPSASDGKRGGEIEFLLRMAKPENNNTAKDWVEGFLSHEGINASTAIEDCIASGLIVITEDQIVKLSQAGKARLDASAQK